MDKIELLGGACFSHGPYTFYKAVRIGGGRVLRLGSFFLTKLWSDADLVSIGELQLLWLDSRGSNQPLASLRLYFLPENTPDGRRDTHGETQLLSLPEFTVEDITSESVDCLTDTEDNKNADFDSIDKEQEWLILGGRTTPAVISTNQTMAEERALTLPQTFQHLVAQFRNVVTRFDEQRQTTKELLEHTKEQMDALKKKDNEFVKEQLKIQQNTTTQDEVLTISEKVVVRVHDLVTWLSPSLEWSWGREVTYPPTPTSSPENSPDEQESQQPQILTDPGIDFSDVEKQQREYESNTSFSKRSEGSGQTRVVVLSYPRYCRYRALLRRLEGAEPSWLCSSLAAALGGFTALPGTRVLFCRDTFDYPDLETHELLCNHLAPKLKGRPRRKRKKRSASPGESSNESETSVASVVALTSKDATIKSSSTISLKGPSSGVRRSERNTSIEEKFVVDVQDFMSSRGTPVGKMPLLGYRQIDLYLFYTKVQTLGGYDCVSSGRLWKTIYDDIGGNTKSTSAATITRRHYERLLLPYERHQRGEDTKIRPLHGRRTKSSSTSEDTAEIKEEPGSSYPSQIPSSETPTSTTVTPPLQSILSTPLLPGDKPRMESGKTSSLRSVRVKPERLKSLNTIIANSTPPAIQANQLPSPPPSANTPATTPTNTPSTTPTGGQSVLERQLNSPLISQQVIPPSSPTGLPVSTVANSTNASTVVTLTPPPEKDMKEMKLDPKQTSLLAQGKENIPLFGEKPIVSPRSPEVIDLETESDTSRDKIIIPSFKKRKLEILREGGLEVTAVELETRPSVIQATITPTITGPSSMSKFEEKTASPLSTPAVPNSMPKLISVTVTPDIGHMLPSPHENQNSHPPIRIPTSIKQNNNNNNISNNNNNISTNNNNMTNSRVINLGTANNASLLQLYANANVVPTPPPSNHRFASPVLPNGRLAPPKVTQSRSIFVHNEKTVYGNPKDIIIPPKYLPPPPPPPPLRSNHSIGGILDLRQKINEKPTFSRPSLEIVRVPVVPRPTPLNLEMKNGNRDKQLVESQKIFPNYPSMLDSRTMASNNLEITLVNPKQKSLSGTPPLPPPPPPVTRNNVQLPVQRRQQANGKYPPRGEPLSPYTPRKPNHVVIPNVPNLTQLNNVANASFSRTMQQQIAAERRKAEVGKEHRRTSEGDRSSTPQQEMAQRQQTEAAARRHSVPNLPSGFIPTLPQSPAFLSQMPNPTGKFLPMLDPMYYSAFYNGLFPPPIPPTTAPPFLPPEFGAYYKELLATSQPRLAMTEQHQPAVPTSK